MLARRDLAAVGTSFGAYPATLVSDRLEERLLVLVQGMLPVREEQSKDWFANTGWEAAVAEHPRRDGGLTGSDDPFVAFYYDVPRALAEEALRRGRRQSDAAGRVPWPLADWPRVSTRSVPCTQDRFLPPAFVRRVGDERLGIVPDEIAAGHCVALSRRVELAELLDRFLEDR